MNKWLRGTSLNSSLAKVYNGKIDEVAAYDTFVQHWYQVKQIIKTTSAIKKISGDEVTAVINHLQKMVNLLVVDLHQLTEFKFTESNNSLNEHSATSDPLMQNGKHSNDSLKPFGEAPPTPIYDYFMGERILEIVLQWCLTTGEYVHGLQLELLKVYEMILTHSHPEVLVFKPITEPLLKLLQSCSGCVPVEVEKRLVVLLNHLWVTILHNPQLLEYFYNPKELDLLKRFLVFSLLLPFVHREGGLGQQARDTLLLCMSLCAKTPVLAEYIAKESNFCPIVAAGLSGLYSMLPRTLNSKDENFYHLCPSDVSSCSSLQMFMNSLEFCNAVVQTAHPLVSKQLVELLYQGFLLPVVAPALNQNVTEEFITAIVYFEFFLQTVSEDSLKRAFLSLLFLPQSFVETSLATMLLGYLYSDNLQLSMVVVNLFKTIIGLYCEDAMIVLVFQYLTPCSHIMLSQISKLTQPSLSAEHFIKLLPIVCQFETADASSLGESSESSSQSLTSQSNSECSSSYENGSTFLQYLPNVKAQVSKATYAYSCWTWKYNGQSPSPNESVHLLKSNNIIRSTSVDKSDVGHRSLPCAEVELSPIVKKRTLSLPDIYRRRNIVSTVDSGNFTFPKHFNPNGEELLHSWFTHSCEEKSENCQDSIDESSGYESFTFKGSRESSPIRWQRKSTKHKSSQELLLKEDEFLQFLESYRTPPEFSEENLFSVIDEAYDLIVCHKLYFHTEDDKEPSELAKEKYMKRLTTSASLEEIKTKCTVKEFPKPTIGPFLDGLFDLIEDLHTLNMDGIILVMSCLSTLAALPSSLVTSLLLDPSVVLQPAVRSLYQVLGQLKQKIDSILSQDDVYLLKEARVKICFSAIEENLKNNESVSLPLIRDDSKRKSFSKTVSSFLKRTTGERSSGREIALQNLPDGSGFRYFNTSAHSRPSSAFSSVSVEKQRAAICCVLLKDWILELTAISLEHLVNSREINFSSIKQAPS